LIPDAIQARSGRNGATHSPFRAPTLRAEETVMRTVMLTAVLALLLPATADAADVYAPPVYRAPPAAYIPPPPRHVAPVVVERPLGVITVPQGWAYVVPQPAYQAGHEYVQSPVLLDARHYRRCWHEWGQLRCTVLPGWGPAARLFLPYPLFP
jgi:hypothetical protein